MSSQLTFITTCRGRLEHLKQSLPRMVQQPDSTCVVVDYDCPDRAGDWVEANFPQVTVVRSGPRQRFELARARNLGATQAKGQWLAFVDADALVASNFSTAMPVLRPGSFYLADPKGGSLVGQCVCRREDFERIGGYDAVLQGWGMEDKDLYFRLEMIGVGVQHFAAELLAMIDHSNEMRVQHYDVKQRKLSSTVNFTYCRAKWDLMRLGAVAEMGNEATRKALYGQVTRAMDMARGIPFSVEIPFASQPTFSGATLTGSLVYKVGN